MSLVPVSRAGGPELERFVQRRGDVAHELRSLADALVSVPDGPLAPAERGCASALRDYAADLETGRFLVAVLGVAKVGKSTLLNALAGDSVSPVDILVSTGVLYFVGWSEQPRCSVVYRSGRADAIPPATRDQYIDDRLNRENARGVERVIYTAPSFRIPHELTFVDTPGLQTLSDAHQRASLELARQCHAAILISSGRHPFLAHELHLFNSLADVIPDLFLVQNLEAETLTSRVPLECQTVENLIKIGLVEAPEAERPALFERLRDAARDGRADELERIERTFGLRLYSLDARTAYRTVLELARGVGPEREAELRNSLRDCGFEAFRAELMEFLAERRGANLIESVVRKGVVNLEQVAQLVRLRQESLDGTEAQFQERLGESERRARRAVEEKGHALDRFRLACLDEARRWSQGVLQSALPATLERINARFGTVNEYAVGPRERQEIDQELGRLATEVHAGYEALSRALHEAALRLHQEVRGIVQTDIGLPGPAELRLPALAELRLPKPAVQVGVVIHRAALLTLALVLYSSLGALVGGVARGFGASQAAATLIGLAATGAAAWAILWYFRSFSDVVRLVVSKLAGQPVTAVLPPQVQRVIHSGVQAVQTSVEHFVQRTVEAVETHFAGLLRQHDAIVEQVKTERQSARIPELRQQNGELAAAVENARGRLLQFLPAPVPAAQAETLAVSPPAAGRPLFRRIWGFRGRSAPGG